MTAFTTTTSTLQPKSTTSIERAFSPALFRAFVEFVDRASQTTRTYLINLRQFAAFLNYTNCQRPAREDVLSYRQWLLSEHDAIQFDQDDGWKYQTDRTGHRKTIQCKPNTVQQYLRSVKQFFQWTEANGLYPNVAANIHAPKMAATHKKDSLTAQEVVTVENSILAHAAARRAAAQSHPKDTAGRIQRSTEQGKRLFAMYLLAVNAGLRTIELSRANVKDLETKGGQTWLYIWGKGHTEPDVKKPLAPEVKAALDDYLNSRQDSFTGTSPLFVSTSNRSRGKRLAPTTISTMLKGALQEAGFDSERLTAHSLRHTAGQNVLAVTGSNIYQTQLYMRHSDPKTTEIYLDNDNTRQDGQIAVQLYRHYHGGLAVAADQREQLQAVIAMLPSEQVIQLLSLAKLLQQGTVGSVRR